MKERNYYKSEELAELAFNNLEKCIQIRSYENMGLELDLWVTKYRSLVRRRLLVKPIVSIKARTYGTKIINNFIFLF